MHHPDELDVRILKDFGSPSWPQWNVRESYEKVADRIGVDEEDKIYAKHQKHTAVLEPYTWLHKAHALVRMIVYDTKQS
jgi:hypothetical protein